MRDYVLVDGVFSSVPIGQGVIDFPSILDELVQVGESRDRFVLAMEMDLDAGGPDVEDEAVRECAHYMADWSRRMASAHVA